jgi:hypothetical protein
MSGFTNGEAISEEINKNEKTKPNDHHTPSKDSFTKQTIV